MSEPSEETYVDINLAAGYPTVGQAKHLSVGGFKMNVSATLAILFISIQLTSFAEASVAYKGQLNLSLSPYRREFLDLSFSEDSLLVFSRGFEESSRVKPRAERQVVSSLGSLTPVYESNKRSEIVAIDPTGRYVFEFNYKVPQLRTSLVARSISSRADVIIIAEATEQGMSTSTLDFNLITGFDASGDNFVIASSYWVRWGSLKSRQVRHFAPPPGTHYVRARFSPRGSYLALQTERAIYIFETATGRKISSLDDSETQEVGGRLNRISSVEFGQSEDHLLIDSDQMTFYWNIHEVKPFFSKANEESKGTIRWKTRRVMLNRALNEIVDYQRASSSDRLCFYSMSTGLGSSCLAVDAMMGSISAIDSEFDISSDGKFIITTGYAGRSLFIDAKNKVILKSISTGEYVHDASFSPDSKRALLLLGNGEVVIYRVPEMIEIGRAKTATGAYIAKWAPNSSDFVLFDNSAVFKFFSIVDPMEGSN